MKRWLFVVVLGFIVATWAFFPPVLDLPNPFETTVAAQEQDPAKITVYVRRTGEKYHRDGCRYLSRSKIAMSLKEAALGDHDAWNL